MFARALLLATVVAVPLPAMSAPAAGGLAAEPPPPAPAAADQARPRWGRAAAEASAALGIATIWYWRDLNLNSRDWDIQWDWSSWARKLNGDYVRFDRNEFWTNGGSHPRSGGILHMIGRSNGLGVPQSVLLNAAATTVWEYLVEFREMVSLNDMAVNPLAGLPIGEAVFQLGSFFRRGRRNVFNWTASTALTPLVTLHDWIDETPAGRPEAVDRLGLSTEPWHRFVLTAGYGGTAFDGDARRPEGHAALHTEIVTTPGYGRPVPAAARVRAGALSALDVELAFDGHTVSDGRFAAQVLLAGLLRQYVSPGGTGVGLLAGLGTRFEYTGRKRPGQFQDLISILGIAGPMVELAVYRGELRLRLRAEGYGDLTMIRPHVYKELLLTTSDFRGFKSPLEWYGYYFAGGYTLSGRMTLDYRAWTVTAQTTWDSAHSVQSLDRFQETITDDFLLHDQRLSVRGSVGARLPRTPVIFVVDAEVLRRSGQIPSRNLSLTTLERRSVASLGLVF